MRDFIEAGETWMRPLNEFRDWLKAIRGDMGKRDGIKGSGAIGPGPFNSETRKKEILHWLLALEKQVERRLIDDAEIAYIQQQWTDEFDVTASALTIAREFGREVGTLTSHRKTNPRKTNPTTWP